MKSEHTHQCEYFNWLHFLSGLPPSITDLIYAVPNGGYRRPKEAVRLKAEGVKPGIPDINIDVARRGFHGARIEMKKGDGTLSPEQVRTHSRLRDAGYFVVTCHSAAAAIEETEYYFELSNTQRDQEEGTR